MDAKKIVVVVEDLEVARTALLWALHNLLRYGDVITLLHVFPSMKTRNKKKLRLLRLEGFQLALSFKEICNKYFFNTKVEIVVSEGDEDGLRIASMVREIGASTLVVGLHEQSFLYKLALAHSNLASNFFNCRVLAIKQSGGAAAAAPTLGSLTNMDFSMIEISRLQVPDLPSPKIPYQICPSPYAIIWRCKEPRKRSSSGSINN
ncbi:uncharacterized protein LOC123195929 [Mangifera indica]|uniref:uncharacterized protein LOC123195929 n=1 Tax=Mangifera indica TaxID=29780 RepID=UPI001CF93F33|nr:uncharacterized protein LOC123195929 [Mangifera indica]